MHIPDGYLSPSTCAGFYAAAAPFWYLALRRVKSTLHTRAVPLLAVFAAFCFVIMMFNLPLPGGTTGHAVGMGMASIVLGPWVSMLAISMALLIQALFFGDGGITAFGANCFNMAIAGSFVAYAVYRLISYGADIASKRRVVAAGLGGYFAINVAALCAAIEFGIQPLLFHNTSGVPLYAPYPLHVAIPAMMIGHLTFAGLAELVISAGVVGYLQRADPALLRLTAPGASYSEPVQETDVPPSSPAVRKLWLILGLALVLTPLGILAVGSAWGEWSATDFSDSAARREIAAASGNRVPPAQAPIGLQRLSKLWKAPLAGYEPSFIRNHFVGYFLSGTIGVGLIILFVLAIGWLFSALQKKPSAGVPSATRRRRSFLERTIRSLLSAVENSLFAEDTARANGLLQTFDARAKLAGIGALIVAAVAVRQVEILLGLLGIAVVLALFSRVPITVVAGRVWLPVLAFTGVIALPAILLVAGETLFRIPLLHWSVTKQGVLSATLLTLRAETAATFSLLLVICTPWHRLLRALRVFRIPTVAIVILEMTHRYIFLLLQTAQNMFESRQTRTVGYFQPAEQRRLAAATAGVLLDKSLSLSDAVHTAMQARGFRGEVYLLEDLQMKTVDWMQLGLLLAMASCAIWLGR